VIESTALITRKHEILFQEFDDELLAVNARAGYAYALNETAGRIWALLAEHRSIEAICAQLCREYVVEESVCLQEVSAVLQELSRAGLVSIDNEASN
jgi:PqqD family protein of HPr-rel-A system